MLINKLSKKYFCHVFDSFKQNEKKEKKQHNSCSSLLLALNDNVYIFMYIIWMWQRIRLVYARKNIYFKCRTVAKR